MSRTCSIDGCGRDVAARGWCQRHWQRWRRTGDPEGSIPRGSRRDAWQHGSRRGFEVGCRCFPCRRANNEYQQQYRQGVRSRVPATEIAAHLETLLRSGWGDREICAEAGVAATTCWYIRSGRTKQVNGRTAAALLAVQPLRSGPVKLDAGPLVAAVRGRGVPLLSLLSTADRKAFHRAEASGTVTDEIADRLLVRACGLTLEEVYGPRWDEQEVAS